MEMSNIKLPVKFRVTTFLENLEISGNFFIVREMSGIMTKVREMSAECWGISVSGKCPPHPYTDICTYCCGHTGVYVGLHYSNVNQIFG
jgi:hypothetical protein